MVDKPKFIDVADDFLSFIGSSTLVAHNADFDVGFLNSELSRAKKEKIKTNRVVDTLKIARTKYPGARNSLDALCKRFSIDNSNRELHGALLDSELLAEVYLELVGGKEPNLELSSITRSPVNRINKSYISQLSRKKKLEPRVSEADEKNHKEFLSSFPKQSIWLKNG